MSERNGLEGFDIEGAINKHYDSLTTPDAPFSGKTTVPSFVEEAPAAPVAEPLPIIGGHEDHDHAPLVVNPPYIIFQYSQTETGENQFNLNVAGIEGGIHGAIAQLQESIAFLEEKIASGEIS